MAMRRMRTAERKSCMAPWPLAVCPTPIGCCIWQRKKIPGSSPVYGEEKTPGGAELFLQTLEELKNPARVQTFSLRKRKSKKTLGVTFFPQKAEENKK